MNYVHMNKRSARLFAATPDELERNRPNLNGKVRVSREAIQHLLDLSGEGNDVMFFVGIRKKEGAEGKPDYFTALLSYPDDEDTIRKFIADDDKWLKDHPRTEADAKRKHEYAMNKRAAVEQEVDNNDELPF